MYFFDLLRDQYFGLSIGSFPRMSSLVWNLCKQELKHPLQRRKMAQMQTMDVHELSTLLREGPEAAQYIDVREPGEYAMASLPYFELLPMSRYTLMRETQAENLVK